MRRVEHRAIAQDTLNRAGTQSEGMLVAPWNIWKAT
jgi:hypothetical protein